MFRLYFAYGSNLHLTQMEQRCPNARPFSAFSLPNARLVFRGVADIIPADGVNVAGGLWWITEECERALDRYEGCRPDGSGLYFKATFKIKLNRLDGTPEARDVLVYRMNSNRLAMPSNWYLDTIREGYGHFQLPTESLEEALTFTEQNMQPRRLEPALEAAPRRASGRGR